MRYFVSLALVAAAPITPLQAAMANDDTPQEESVHEQHQKAAYDMLVAQSGGTTIPPALAGTLTKQMGDAYRLDKDMLALEHEYPGLIDHLLKSTMPIILRQVNDTTPDLLRRQAAYYADNLTRADIAAIAAFYNHPAYPAIREKTERNVDLSNMLADAIQSADEEFEVTRDHLSELNENAANDSMTEFTAAERSLLNRFGETAAGKKMVALEKGALAIEAEWSNESTPEEDKEIEDATIKAIEEFTGLDLSE